MSTIHTHLHSGSVRPNPENAPNSASSVGRESTDARKRFRTSSSAALGIGAPVRELCPHFAVRVTLSGVVPDPPEKSFFFFFFFSFGGLTSTGSLTAWPDEIVKDPSYCLNQL